MIIAVNFPIYAIGNWKPEKNSGFNGIRTRDLRVTGTMLYQLSYEATHHLYPQFIYELFHILYIVSLLSRENGNLQLTLLPMCGFIAQLVEHRTGNAEVTGSNPVEA